MATRHLTIEVVHGSILEVQVQAIVNAANSLGVMGGGVAGVIKRAAGPEVEREACRHAPIPVGEAVVSSGGRTRFKAIIHAPTMARPAMRIDPDHVSLATRAALAAADDHGFSSVALPGLGTGVGGVSAFDAAVRMVQAIRAFQPRVLQLVTLVDIDADLTAAWQQALQRP